MALSKLAIGLIAGIGSIVAVGGITTGVIVSRNNTVTETVNENNESNNKENKTSNDRDALMADQSRSNSTNGSTTMKMQKPEGEKTKKQPDEGADMKRTGTSSVARQETTTQLPSTAQATTVTSGNVGENEASGVKDTEEQQVLMADTSSGAEVMRSETGATETVQNSPNSHSSQDQQDGHETIQPQRSTEDESK